MLIFDQGDEEFPSELTTYYEKTSLEVPTEDAYVFTESYLELMIQIARSQNILIIDTNDLISLGDLADKHPDLERNKVRDDIIVQRFEPIKYINRETAMKVASNLKVNFMSEWEFEKADWVLGFKLFEDLSIFYVKYWDNSKPEMEIYYHVSVLKYDLHLIMNFSWLFLNTVIREGRKILGDEMPRISKFL